MVVDEFDSNHCNLSLSKEIIFCREVLSKVIQSDTCGYSANVVLDRLMQRIVEISIRSHALAFQKSCEGGKDKSLIYGQKINFKRGILEVGTGRLTLTLLQWLRSYADFFYGWLLALVAILSFRQVILPSGPATLLFGLPPERLSGKDGGADLFDYCRNGPITPLRKGYRILVETASRSTAVNNDQFKCTKRPHLKLIQESRIGILVRLRLLINHCLTFYKFSLAALRNPILVLIGKDFAYTSALKEIDRFGLIDSIVFTCSNFDSQPLWSRDLIRAKVHMVWYAQNWRPIAYINNLCISDIPQLQWIRVDKHWVWTEKFALYLKGILQNPTTEVVGPITFNLPKQNGVPDRGQINVVVFDISPFSNEVALANGEISNYFNVENLTLFIDGIVELKKELEIYFNIPVSLKVKTKRGFKNNYEKSFFSYLNELKRSKKLDIIDPNINVYSLIGDSDIVVSYPFTSTNYIADSLRVPSVYFDPTGMVINQNFSDSPSLIFFANSNKALLDVCIKNLKENFY